MEDFIVIITGLKIEIKTTNTTKWFCYASGNFQLSQYAGIGNTTIDVIIPASVITADGYVEFVVNSYHCSSKLRYNINQDNEDYLMVSPRNVNFTKNGDSIKIEVSSTKPWTVTTNSNIIISDINNNGFTIISNSDSDYDTSIVVSNGIQSKNVTIHQKVEHIDDTCMLTINKTPANLDASVFQLNVISKKGANFTSYNVVSQPTNLNLIDDGFGNIRCNVIDLTKDCKGNITIINQCGATKNINVDFIAEIIKDDEFYISYNNKQYINVNILYTKDFKWIDNNIELIYNENYTFNIISLDSNNNKVNWYIKSYDSDIIEANIAKNTLTLRLNDYNENTNPRTIILENELGRHINILFTVANGLIEETSTEFGIGFTEGTKSKNITTNYNNTGITVYLDSYKIEGVETEIRWICSNADEVMKYIVTPTSDNGGHNNKVVILASDDALKSLDDDFVGSVSFQQMETYEYVYVNIQHTAIGKKWIIKESTTTAMTVSPSVVTVPACANQQSEDITVVGYVKIIEQLVDDLGNIYGERTKYDEKNITDVVSWNNPSSDLILKRNGAWLNVYSVTSNPYGSNDRVVNFILVSDGISQTLKATQDTATQSSSGGYNDMDATINDVNLSIAPLTYPKEGGKTISIEKSANVTIKSYITDSCGNVNHATERTREEKYINEVIVKQLNAETVSGFTINNTYTEITVDINPWEYTFNKTEEIEELHFVDKDTPIQSVTINTKKECKIKNAEFVSEYTFSKPFITISKQSPVVILKQEGAEESQNYELESAPNWVIITKHAIDGSYNSQIDVNVEKNTTKEERLGEIVFKQVDSNKKIVYKIRQDARGIIPIPDFNYLVFRYMWNDDAGKDLDTVTVFVNTGIKEEETISGVTSTFALDDKPVGFGYTLNNPVKGLHGNIYLEFSGDNMVSGKESVWINFLEVCNEKNIEELPEEIYADIYAIWYNTKKSGAVEVEISAYKGGTMIVDPSDKFNFINEGGEMSYNSKQNTVVEASGIGKAPTYKTDYSHIARVTYYKETQSAILQLM